MRAQLAPSPILLDSVGFTPYDEWTPVCCRGFVRSELDVSYYGHLFFERLELLMVRRLLIGLIQWLWLLLGGVVLLWYGTVDGWVLPIVVVTGFTLGSAFVILLSLGRRRP